MEHPKTNGAQKISVKAKLLANVWFKILTKILMNWYLNIVEHVILFFKQSLLRVDIPSKEYWSSLNFEFNTPKKVDIKKW
jgi:hypothetical protein